MQVQEEDLRNRMRVKSSRPRTVEVGGESNPEVSSPLSSHIPSTTKDPDKCSNGERADGLLSCVGEWLNISTEWSLLSWACSALCLDHHYDAGSAQLIPIQIWFSMIEAHKLCTHIKWIFTEQVSSFALALYNTIVSVGTHWATSAQNRYICKFCQLPLHTLMKINLKEHSSILLSFSPHL